MARIGIFGGSFNPPHLGHVQAVMEARMELGLDQVLLLPAAMPPHKVLPPHSPDAQTRLELTRLAFAEMPWAEVLDLELRREGPSYTVDSLRVLRAQYPEDELVLLVGTDMFLSLDHWYQTAEICQLAQIAFAAREKRNAEKILAQRKKLETEYGASVVLLDNEVRELSSTEVRRMLAFGQGDALLPPVVAAAIHERGLYLSPKDLWGLPLEQLEMVCISLLKPNRVPHVLGCRDMAVTMAGHHGCDATVAARAALLHDITKALEVSQQLQLCAVYGMISENLTKVQPPLLHAISGALVAERIFGECPEVCSAIRWHTTGKPHMDTLEKILYLADAMECTRDYDGVESLRELAMEDLDAALQKSMQRTIEYVRDRGQIPSPETAEALAWLQRKRI